MNANVIVHDMAKRFPYPDDFFDAVISIKVIHHNMLEKVRKTIKEIRRVLRTNGMIFIVVPIYRSHGRKSKKIAPSTYVPLESREKRIVHYYFTRKKIYEEFREFKIQDIHLDKLKLLCILGIKNNH